MFEILLGVAAVGGALATMCSVGWIPCHEDCSNPFEDLGKAQAALGNGFVPDALRQLESLRARCSDESDKKLDADIAQLSATAYRCSAAQALAEPPAPDRVKAAQRLEAGAANGQQAVQILADLLAVAPNDNIMRLNWAASCERLAEVECARGQQSQAEASLERAAIVYQGQLQYHQWATAVADRASVLCVSGKHAAALDAIDIALTAMRSSPETSRARLDLHFAKARIACAVDQLDIARNTLAEAVEEFRDAASCIAAELLNFRANINMLAGDVESAKDSAVRSRQAYLDCGDGVKAEEVSRRFAGVPPAPVPCCCSCPLKCDGLIDTRTEPQHCGSFGAAGGISQLD